MFASSSMYWPIAVNWVNERRKRPLLRVLVPALERIARDRVDHPVLRGDVAHRVVQQLAHVPVLGADGREPERRASRRGSIRLLRPAMLTLPAMSEAGREKRMRPR